MFNIGVDLTRISRFKDKKNSFLKRVLSEFELKIYNNFQTSEEKTLFLARSWAIKEAIFKADNKFYKFNQINLQKKNNIWFFTNEFKISISHEGDYLVAFVIKNN
ncbi:holo-ACP synthase [Mycoplasma leonicaptivi]|uniref:holo-ACP synthase n=1 Tax=Mycoplasma leonicaptivi TaxID=36742 RepID=UPI0004823765|nr:4'-phosphopantetheinyl transferase superfamily protein [Mycoplasma leonicaptivi]